VSSAITAIIQALFGRDAAIFDCTPLVGGDFNTTFRVSTSEGEVVVRLLPNPTDLLYRYERNLMQAEVEAYRRLSSIGVPTPAVLRYDRSCEVVPHPYLVVTFLSGATLKDAELTTEERAKIDEELGRHCREMHALNGEGFGFLADKLLPSWFEFLTQLLDEIAERSERWSITPIKYIERLTRVLHDNRDLFSIPSPRFLHNDLHDRNVLVAKGEEGWSITGIIDPDRALLGDPSFELATSELISPSFLEGYGEERLSEEEGYKRRAYNLLYDMREADVCLVQRRNMRVYQILEESIARLSDSL